MRSSSKPLGPIRGLLRVYGSFMEQLSFHLIEQPVGEPLDVHSVGEWQEQSAVFVCPGGYQEPGPCECGYQGLWLRRVIFEWHTPPGRARDYSGAVYRQKGGWRISIGFDEKCPGCGDIERFDSDGNLRALMHEEATILRLR